MSKQSLASLAIKAYHNSNTHHEWHAVYKRISRIITSPELYAQVLATYPHPSK